MADLQFCTILLTLLSLFGTWLFTRRLVTRTKRLPPSPPALPVIGNLHQLGKPTHRSLWQLSKKFGPLMLVHLGSHPTLVVSSGAVAREVLKTHDVAFSDKPAMSSNSKIFYGLKDLLSLPYGDHWRKLRGIFVQELMSSTRVRSFASIREEESWHLLKRIKRSVMSPVDLTAEFIAMTNNQICLAAFGKKHSETPAGKEFLAMLEAVCETLFNFKIGELVPWLAWINDLNGYNATLDSFFARIDELMDGVIADHLSTEGKSKRTENFVDMLLDICKDKTPGLSIDLDTIKALILDVFGAGTETSATALTWVMTEVLRHPRVMTKLQAEVRGTMGGKHRITDEELQKMEYVKAVIKETLRLHPPVATYFRAAREHTNLMGYDIEPKTWVLINAWAIGRDPSYWHDPENFIPERFTDSSLDFKGFDFHFIPFGAGRRICAGIGFATLALEHAVANLMHKFDWALPDGAKGEELNMDEKTGFIAARKDHLIAIPSKCYF